MGLSLGQEDPLEEGIVTLETGILSIPGSGRSPGGGHGNPGDWGSFCS